MIDLAGELTAWLRSDETRRILSEIIRDAVREQISRALKDELVGVTEAATILKMSEAALRKAAERGQIACQRIGRRLRFRRSDLIAPTRGL